MGRGFIEVTLRLSNSAVELVTVHCDEIRRFWKRDDETCYTYLRDKAPVQVILESYESLSRRLSSLRCPTAFQAKLKANIAASHEQDGVDALRYINQGRTTFPNPAEGENTEC